MQASTLETIFSVISLLLFLGMLLLPFAIAKWMKGPDFLLHLFISITISGILCLLFIYWREELSKQLLLYIYGFNTYGMGEEERWGAVLPANRVTLQQVYESMFGIGWPLKVFFAGVLFVTPYSIITCTVSYYFRRKKVVPRIFH